MIEYNLLIIYIWFFTFLLPESLLYSMVFFLSNMPFIKYKRLIERKSILMEDMGRRKEDVRIYWFKSHSQYFPHPINFFPFYYPHIKTYSFFALIIHGAPSSSWYQILIYGINLQSKSNSVHSYFLMTPIRTASNWVETFHVTSRYLFIPKLKRAWAWARINTYASHVDCLWYIYINHHQILHKSIV